MLESVYPKLKTQNGAYELLRAERGGKGCPLLVMPHSSTGYSIEYIRDNVSANTLIYIRPIQSKLCMSKVTNESQLNSKCQFCEKEISISRIRAHVAICNKETSQPSQSSSASNDVELIDDESEIHFATSTSTVPSKDNDTKENVEWSSQLSKLFPDLESKDIDDAILSVDTIDEAANCLMDKTDPSDTVSMFGKRRKIFNLPQSLNVFLTDFAKSARKEGYDELVVDREAVWSCTLKYYKRKLKDCSALAKALEVVFKNEDGIDGGAMRSEYFHLVMGEVSKHLFEGDSSNLIPVKDSTKFILFRLAGMMMVHLIIQEGPLDSLPALAPTIIECILGRDADEVSLSLSKHQIPLNAATEHTHNFIERLDTAKTEEAIRQVLFEDDNQEVYWQIINNCHWPKAQVVDLSNKSMLVQEIIYNETVASRRDEIKELSEGLEILGFLDYAKQHPKYLKELFSSDNERKPFELADFEKAIFSSANTFAEKQALDWLFEYLKISSSGDFYGGSRLTALLMFCTGSTCPPRLGFIQKIQIKFLQDDDEKELPTSSGCLRILHLPTVHSSKQKFFAAMDIALKYGALGFPNP
eukprot:gene14417-15924_t